MRQINKFILHCSASDLKEQTAAMIDKWHKKRGWNGIGYHYFIRSNGLIEGGRDVETIGAHCLGSNQDSIGICLAGHHHFYSAQFRSLEGLLQSLRRVMPTAKVYGHNEFNANKECPVFPVDKFKKG